MNIITKRILMVLIGVGVFIGIFFYINQNLYRFFAGTTSILVNVVPVTQTKNVNEEFTVNLMISGQDIYATDLKLVYDSDYLQYFKEYTPTKTGVIMTDTLFEPTPAIETVSTVDTTHKKLRAVLISQSKTVSKGTSVAFKFKAIKAGTASVVLDPTSMITGKDPTSGVATTYTLNILDPKSTITIGSITTTNTPTPVGMVCTTNPLPTADITKSGILSQSPSKMTILTQRVNVEKNRTYTFKFNASNKVDLVQTTMGIAFIANMVGDASTSSLSFGSLPKTVAGPNAFQATWNSGNNTYVDMTFYVTLPSYFVGPTPTGSLIMRLNLVPEVYAVTAPDPSYSFTVSGLSFTSCAAPTATPIPPTNTPVPPTATKAPTATPVLLPAPLTLSVKCDPSGTQATFTWSTVNGAVGGYYFTADNTANPFPGGTGDISEWGVTSTSITRSILKDAAYIYNVQALDGADNPGLAKSGRFVCAAPTSTAVPPTSTPVPPTATKAPTATPIKLPAPLTLSAKCNTAGTQVTISWSAVTGAVGGYLVGADNTTNGYPGGNGDIYEWGVTTTSITKPIVSNVLYNYGVQALDSADNVGNVKSGTFQCNVPTSTPILSTSTPVPPTATKAPTATLTKAPPTLTSKPNCSLRAKGDANCDDVVDLLDYSCWRGEFLGNKPANCVSADFDGIDGAALLDFSIWKITFLSNNQ